MIPIKPDLIQKSKRKTVSLVIDGSARIIAKIPLRMTRAELDVFLERHRGWIEKHLEKKRAVAVANAAFFDLKSVLFLGGVYEVTLTAAVKKPVFTENGLLLPLSKPPEKSVEKLFRVEAEKTLFSKACEVLAKSGLAAKEFKLINGKSKWGSCSKDGKISFNWRAVMLPERLITYLAVHEAMHLFELNHSKRFWALVSERLPEYKSLRKELKTYAWAQMLFRD